MPDIHWGYGFSIGGVAATDPEQGGVISPGGVGYDINCGVRLLRSDLAWDDVKARIRPLVDQLFRDIPTGVGQRGQATGSTSRSCVALMEEGSSYVVEHGLRERTATSRSPRRGGRLDGADPDGVSDRASAAGPTSAGRSARATTSSRSRSSTACSTRRPPRVMGLREGQVTVLIHSRLARAGLPGLRRLPRRVQDSAPKKYGFALPDWQLACAPVRSPEGQAYLGAMRAAANYAWCNRQLLTHQAREVFARSSASLGELGMDLVYDVAHNIAKFEDHDVGGGWQAGLRPPQGGDARLPARLRRVPPDYREIGQPVIIPGDMGRDSGSWPAPRKHGSHLRHHLPRRRPGDEPRQPVRLPRAGTLFAR